MESNCSVKGLRGQHFWHEHEIDKRGGNKNEEGVNGTDDRAREKGNVQGG